MNSNNKVKAYASKHSFIFLITLSLFSNTSCNEDDPSLDDELKNEAIEGEYKGRWISEATRADFNVQVSSEIIKSGDNYFSGSFYISNDFTPCCGDVNDGTIAFNIESDSILNFIFNDVIPGCIGTFSGSGVISDSGRLAIEFTGNDCDGDHVGRIWLEK
ncbi:MAG: hypothetical protein AB8B73_07595 [Ekhidna sp.]